MFIGESKYINADGSKVEFLKMKAIDKENLLSLMLSINNFSLLLIDDIVQKCSSAKKVSVVDNEENNCKELNDNEINLDDYENIN